MGFLACRRFRKWTVRARPHLERFHHTLAVTQAGISEQSLVAAADQLDAAGDELGDFLRRDPCPLPELAAAYATAVLIVTAVANVFAAWHRIVPVEQQAAVERTRALMPDADRVRAVLARFPFT